MKTKTPISLNLIVCATVGNGIGKSGKLPWKLKKDMKYFKFITSFIPSSKSTSRLKSTEIENQNQNLKNVVIMGRKTWESIPRKFKPLENRINIIVSRKQTYESLGLSKDSKDVYLTNSILNACEIIQTLNIYKTYLIGGSELYNQIIKTPILANIYELKTILLTRVLGDDEGFECDTFLSDFKETGNWKMSDNQRFLEWISLGIDEGEKIDLQDELGFNLFEVNDDDGNNQIEFQLWEPNSLASSKEN
ncbi:uncharacterized protein MELLADRAFT_104435 [Melampsora larici-populina 98AG31]|uniref:Dihydrofolate reductase n=1 Tax=Melampsora larici-populina (strain 98AG31 / pathotype 3-4-7) TaxID=747676 RepID=F4REP2_MELLP|nr:uncharacterized protein MELLADRAFT_104435 [Melampsora larici-populina 98AG31]EGG09245.1 hypothetical protein MELLADRAFT_104435 [Melampsora larici-populina 98AG31]